MIRKIIKVSDFNTIRKEHDYFLWSFLNVNPGCLVIKSVLGIYDKGVEGCSDYNDMVDILNIFEDLKLRAGWGEIGNHGIGAYGTLSDYGINGQLYGTPGNGTSVVLSLNNIANPNLTWETTEQINLGLDFESKNSRVSGSIDFYEKTTKDLLQNTPIPTSSGFSNIPVSYTHLTLPTNREV